MPLKFDSQGWLIPGSDPNIKVDKSIITAKTYDNFSPLVGGKAAGIVWHWTGNGQNYGGLDNCGKSPNSCITNYMLKEIVDPGRKASWNFYLNKKGELWQHASIAKPTWTTSGSTSPVYLPGLKVAGKEVGGEVPVHVNKALLGIEMENAGILLQQNGEWFAWPYNDEFNKCSGTSMCGENDAEAKARPHANNDLKAKDKVLFDKKYKVDPKRVVMMGGKAFDSYTRSQVQTATELTKALKEALGWTSPRQVHYSHEQFVPKSKRDPGLVWMDGILPQLEVNVFGRRAGSEVGIGIGSVGALAAVAALGVGYYLWQRSRTA